jgi:hypothetical protein
MLGWGASPDLEIACGELSESGCAVSGGMRAVCTVCFVTVVHPSRFPIDGTADVESPSEDPDSNFEGGADTEAEDTVLDSPAHPLG